MSKQYIKIWDPLIRLGHWVLVAAFFIAYFTEDEFLSLHVWAGYAVGAIVLGRVVWGFLGPQHARFADFLYNPRTTLNYLWNLLRGGGQRYLGHSPAGGLMVMLLLLGLIATTWSGLMVYAYDQQAGPFAAFVVAPSGVTSGDEIDEENEVGEASGMAAAFTQREQFWEEAHEVIANLSLLLVIVHIGGVFLASFVHKENLVAAMVTGKKRDLADGHRGSEDDAPSDQRTP